MGNPVNRQSLLAGLLIGLFLGAGATWINWRVTSLTRRPALHLTLPAPPQPAFAPREPLAPPDDHRNEINGQKYSIIPLASRT
jgi:hypothetical protein